MELKSFKLSIRALTKQSGLPIGRVYDWLNDYDSEGEISKKEDVLQLLMK